MRTINVFVSSRFAEFRELRGHLSVLAAESDVNLIDLDDGRPDDRDALGRSLQMLDSADLCVLVLGQTYSESVGRAVSKSITELEFEHVLKQRDAGRSIRIRAWQRADERMFTSDALEFLERVKSEVVVGKLPHDWFAAAESIIDDARTETDLLADDGLAESAADLISRELARLGLTIGEYPTGADPVSMLVQRRSLGMQALKVGNMKEAIKFFLEAREMIGFDVVTNLALALLFQRTMIPSYLAQARLISDRLESEQAFNVENRTPEQMRRLNVLAGALRANLDRTLGHVGDASSARAGHDRLEPLLPQDETSRPLLIELAAWAALSGDERLATDRFRDLWHIYPDAALAVLSSPAFVAVRGPVEGQMCRELAGRADAAGVTLPPLRSLRRLRRAAIQEASTMRTEMARMMSECLPTLVTMNRLAEQNGIGADLYALPGLLDARFRKAEADFGAVMKDINELVSGATIVDRDVEGMAEDNVSRTRRLSVEWAAPEIVVPGEGSLPLEDVMADNVVDCWLRSRATQFSAERAGSSASDEAHNARTELLAFMTKMGLAPTEASASAQVAILEDLRDRVRAVGGEMDAFSGARAIGEPAPWTVLHSMETNIESGNKKTRKKMITHIVGFWLIWSLFLNSSTSAPVVFVAVGLMVPAFRELIDWREKREDIRANAGRLTQLVRSLEEVGLVPNPSGQQDTWKEVRGKLSLREADVTKALTLAWKFERAVSTLAKVDETIALWRQRPDQVRKALIASSAHVAVMRHDECVARRDRFSVDLELVTGPEFEALRQVPMLISSLNRAFATAPAIAFPEYVPRERAGLGDLTRTTDSAPAADRNSRRMAVCVEVDNGATTVSESALALPRPGRAITDRFDEFLRLSGRP